MLPMPQPTLVICLQETVYRKGCFPLYSLFFGCVLLCVVSGCSILSHFRYLLNYFHL